ncbi:hypothetical protein WJ16_22380 [Burkholderia metallica]|nr:hypothetical protein WJ16_22380 [Burkholderia metallica]
MAGTHFQCRGQHAHTLQEDDGNDGRLVVARALRLRLGRWTDHPADDQAEHVRDERQLGDFGYVGRRDVGDFGRRQFGYVG